MDNFKSNFVSQALLESLLLFFFYFIQNITKQLSVFGHFILAIIAQLSCGNHLLKVLNAFENNIDILSRGTLI